MKRVIKFRAYTEISNEVLGMKYDVPHDYNDTVMQFTGLLDRHGKEIYERDVICWVDEVAVEEIEGHIRYEPEGKFVEVKIPDFYFFTDDTVSSEECEIIGNVYESPELIKTT